MPKSFLKRYQEGEHAAVWNELVVLGPGVRHKLYYADAAAVAAETMRRARHNVELLIGRLQAMGYRFLTMEVSYENHAQALTRLRKMTGELSVRRPAGDPARLRWPEVLRSRELRELTVAAADRSRDAAIAFIDAGREDGRSPLEDPDVFSPPNKNTVQGLNRLEKLAGGPLPLSLRAWYEQVGGVSLLGWHSTLHPNPDEPAGLAGTAPDPLMIHSLDLVMQMTEEEGSEGEIRLPLAPDAVFKAGEGGGGPYEMIIPDASADALFHDDNRRTFVNYLRNAFQWGGFPGWEDSKNPPRAEIAQLADGLLSL